MRDSLLINNLALAQALRRAVDRDHERLLETNTKQYFFIIAWFLQAERVRRQIAAKERPKDAPVNETDSFSVVAGVLNQEFLIVLQKKMQEWYELKMWNEIQAGMKCFTQIMYTVQDMAMSKIEEDQEIAENIQNRLFYEESTMFLVVDLLKAYTIQPLK